MEQLPGDVCEIEKGLAILFYKEPLIITHFYSGKRIGILSRQSTKRESEESTGVKNEFMPFECSAFFRDSPY